MSVLAEFDKLETIGIWHSTDEDPGQRVVVKLNERYLTLFSFNGRPLAHWAMSAVQRGNPGSMPANYSPDDQYCESLEISDSYVVSLLDRQLQHPVEETDTEIATWSWRAGTTALISVLVLALAAYIVASNLAGWTASLTTAAKSKQLGERAFNQVTEIVGGNCRFGLGGTLLDTIAYQFLDNRYSIRIVRGQVPDTMHLPGGIIIISEALLLRSDQPEVFVGHLLEEKIRSELTDPLAMLLELAGLQATVNFALRGEIDESVLRDYALEKLRGQRQYVNPDAVFAELESEGVSALPFAQAIGWTETLYLGDGGAQAGEPPSLLSNNDWLSIRKICDQIG
ncbi:MAG: hypothetical protein OXF74_11450 [Rhodobacteraceae bacterium]|nr:hypothetical protein [Paracoccaceae bacterium]